jgi:hypothetical protein
MLTSTACTARQFFKILKIEISYNPEILLSFGYIPKGTK